MPDLVLTPEAVKMQFRAKQITLPSVVAGAPTNVGQFLTQAASAPSVAPLLTKAPSLNIAAKTALPGPTVGAAVARTPSLTASPSIRPATRPTGTPLTVPPALFVAASNDLADVGFQKQVSEEFSKYIDGIVSAIRTAHTTWRTSAFLSGIVINGPIASGGKLKGQDLEPLIAGSGPQTGLFGSAGAYTRAIAAGIKKCWTLWQDGVTVPGLPWYPGFAAFPAPIAPPTPNVPTPLIALRSPFVSKLTTPNDMKTEMSVKLGSAGPYSPQLFDALASALATSFLMWLNSQMVANVMGKGTVPTFAPPYVPVGPVVMGDNIPTPGHVMV